MQNHAFNLSPSRIYAALLAVTLIASVMIVVLLPLSLLVKVLGVAMVVGYMTRIFWRYALLRASLSIVGLQQVKGGEWRVITGSNSYSASLRGDSTVTSLFSVLRFNFAGIRQPVSCMIFRDSLAVDEYRRLVGAIRMGG